jgi:hypothetical protein
VPSCTQTGMDEIESEAIHAEGLDLDDLAVVTAIGWHGSLQLGRLPIFTVGRGIPLIKSVVETPPDIVDR